MIATADNDPLVFGKLSGETTWPFDGQLSNVSIYNRVLTGAEIVLISRVMFCMLNRSPYVLGGGTIDVTVTPSALSLTSAVVAPSVIGDVSISPNALALTSGVVAPAIFTGSIASRAVGLVGNDIFDGAII